MNQRDTKIRMQTLLDSLDYDFRQFTLDDFTRWLERHRGRKIAFIPLPLPAAMFGAWVKGITEDCVFYEQNTPGVHQAHIQLHELSHMMCGHPTVDLSQHTGGGLAVSHSLLLRSAHSDENEQEAEILTALIQERVQRHARMEELYKTVESDHGNFLMTYLETLRD